MYYKIIGIHFEHGVCELLAYDSSNTIIGGNFGKFELKKDAIDAIKNAVSFQKVGKQNNGAPASVFQKTVMEFYEKTT